MKQIIVQAMIHGNPKKVWEMFTSPEAIQVWNHASSDWICPHAENDLRVGGKCLCRMEAKDGSAGFDFVGTYTAVVPYEQLAYTIEDGRQVVVQLEKLSDSETKLTETFEMESENSEQLQRDGWQAILNNFKEYVETH